MCRNTFLEVLHVECKISSCEIRFFNTAIFKNFYGFFYLVSEKLYFRSLKIVLHDIIVVLGVI
jgi:hypothetical protein